MNKCRVCGYDKRGWMHWERCFEAFPYVRCVVPRCGILTRNPTEWGTCPPHLHDMNHEAWVAERVRESA